MTDEMDREVAKVRAKSDAAMRARAAEGSTRQGMLEAGFRASLDHSVSTLDPDLANLEAALRQGLDGGAFLMGMMAASFAMQGTNLIELVSLPWARRLFVEYIERARRRDADPSE